MPHSLQRIATQFSELKNIEALSWVVSLSAIAIILAAGYAVRRVLFARLQQWARSTNSKVGEVLLSSLYRPWMLWMLMLGIYAATEISDLPDPLAKASGRTVATLWIVSVTWVLSRAAGKLVRLHGSGADGTRTVGTLSQVLASIVVVLIGTLTLLNSFDIEIRPYLAALGVGGLAVALALQDTLSNFFAGFYVSVGSQVRVGDFIQLDSGSKGYVSDIGWRTTTLRELTNNMVIIPNNKLAQAIITNYTLPEPRSTLLIPVSVSYDSDPDQVQQALLDVVTQASADVPGILMQPPPRARLSPGFGDNSLQFTLSVQVVEYERQQDVGDELRKRIFRRFQQEGIVMPSGVRTLEIRQPASDEPGSRPAS